MYYKSGEENRETTSGTYKPAPKAPPKPLTKETIDRLREVLKKEQQRAK